MSQPRVVITRVGIVSAFGAGFARHIEAMFGTRSAIGPLTLVDVAGARVATAGQVPDEALAAGPSGASRADRMAITAAAEAMSGLAEPERAATAVVVGGTTGGMLEAEPSLARLTADPTTTDFDAACIPGHVLTSPTDRVHEALGPFAWSHTVCSACSGGAAAIAIGAAAIRQGRAVRVLAGGVDALGRMSLAGFASLMALDLAPCRPFDAARAGLSLGEGAAFLILEREDVAAARGARAIAEIAGWAIASEAHHATQPAPDGRVIEATMRRALSRAGLPARVDYVSAHGTATPANDATEAAAIERAFGRVAVSSAKGHIGHTLAAAGAIEAAITAVAIDTGRLPPTAGLAVVDPACAALDHVREAREANVEVAISNAFGFGGTDVVLALRKAGSASSASPASLSGEPSAELVVTAVASHAGGDLPMDLDPVRARRFDRASRLATCVSALAMRSGPTRERTGVVVGSSFGAVEATGRVLREIFEKGARFVSPAVFPTILPSALAANASLYLGIQGPAIACADLGASAEAALAIGALLLEDEQAEAMLVVGVEEASEVARLVSSPRISELDGSRRGEGAAALLVERRAEAERRGARPLAILRRRWSWRGARPILPGPRGSRPLVLSARELSADWPSDWPRPRVVADQGHHESAGGLALVAAVESIASGEADEALVLGHAPDRGHAFLFTAP
jgi:3-oxoacyl-[acyl-carrier-protein] synthase II